MKCWDTHPVTLSDSTVCSKLLNSTFTYQRFEFVQENRLDIQRCVCDTLLFALLVCSSAHTTIEFRSAEKDRNSLEFHEKIEALSKWTFHNRKEHEADKTRTKTWKNWTKNFFTYVSLLFPQISTLFFFSCSVISVTNCSTLIVSSVLNFTIVMQNVITESCRMTFVRKTILRKNLIFDNMP